MNVIRFRIPGVLALVAGLGMSVGVVLPTGTAEAQTRYTVTDLGTLGGCCTTGASGINSNGQVAGSAVVPSHAFFWQGGTMTDLGTLGGDVSFGFGISGNGA